MIAWRENWHLFVGVFVGFLAVGGGGLGIAVCVRSAPRTSMTAEPPTPAATIAVDPQASAKAEAAKSRADSARANSDRTKRIEGYHTWAPAQRASSALASGRNLKIATEVGAELAEAGRDDQEKNNLIGIFAVGRSSALLAAGSDADRMEWGAANAGFLSLSRIKHIKMAEKTSISESRKDPGANMGKWLEVSGSVVQIRRDEKVFRGLMLSESLKAISFITASTTKGIVEGSPGTFVGLLVSDYNFANVSGGQTQSLLLAGHFTGQGQD